jgi:hypothetical protein
MLGRSALRGISVRQPWAWAIARGHKKIMNLASGTDYRGPVAIYASFRVDPGSRGNRLLDDRYWDSSDPAAAVGGIVAVATLVGVCSAATTGGPCGCGEWASADAYHWRLADPRPLRWPVLAVHGTGLWEVVPAVAAGVARLLPSEVVNCSTATRGAAAMAAELDSVDSRTDCPAPRDRPAG